MKSFIIATLLTLTQASQSKCRAIAFSSGDEDAAYQAGVIKGLTSSEKLSAEDTTYDAVSGISGGAINAVLLAEFAKGKEVDAAVRMTQFWTDASKQPLYKNWAGGVARGLFYEGGLYNSAPMEDFLKTQFHNTTIERDVNIGIVNVKDGEYKSFTKDNITQGTNLNDALFASLSFAGFFPPAEVQGSSYFDGSAVWDIDIFSAINKCSQKGFKDEDIIVDVVMTSSANIKQVEAENYKSIQMLFRYLEISSFYNTMDGLLRAKFAYKKVNFRYVISPTSSIPSSLRPLNLDQKDVEKAIDLGVKDAQAAIAKGEAATLDDLIHYHALKKTGDMRMLKHSLGTFKDAKAAGEFEDYDILKDVFMNRYTYKEFIQN